MTSVDGDRFGPLLALLKSAYPKLLIVQEMILAEDSILLRKRETDGSCYLHVACCNTTILSNLEAMHYLVQSCPQALSIKNKFGQTSLHKALSVASSCHKTAIEYMLRSAPDQAALSVTKDGQSILHVALSHPKESNTDIVDLVVDLYPSLVDLPDRYGQYPIHVAVGKKQVSLSIIKKLVGALPSSLLLKDAKGFTPLHWVLSRSLPDAEVLFYMCEQCPNALFEVDKTSCTPYMRYIQRDDHDIDIEQALMDIIELHRHRQERKQLYITIPAPKLRKAGNEILIKKSFKSSSMGKGSPSSSISYLSKKR